MTTPLSALPKIYTVGNPCGVCASGIISSRGGHLVCANCGWYPPGSWTSNATERGGPSSEGTARADVRGDRATGETGNDRPAAPVSLSSKTVSVERLRNTLNWAQARIGTLSGAEVIVSAIEQVLACEPFLKEGETPVECIEHNRKDADGVCTLLVREKRKTEAARVLLHDASAQTGEYQVTNWMQQAREWVALAGSAAETRGEHPDTARLNWLLDHISIRDFNAMKVKPGQARADIDLRLALKSETPRTVFENCTFESVPAATPPAPDAAPNGATNGSAAAGTVLPDRIFKVPQ